jgi:hypothetical protein
VNILQNGLVIAQSNVLTSFGSGSLLMHVGIGGRIEIKARSGNVEKSVFVDLMKPKLKIVEISPWVMII